MSNFVKIGKGQTQMLINKNDIVSIKKEGQGFISICYKTVDETGNSPFRIEEMSYGINDREYMELISELNNY